MKFFSFIIGICISVFGYSQTFNRPVPPTLFRYEADINQSVSGTWTTVSDVNKRLQLKLDLKTFFENAASPINVRTDFMTHSPSAADVLGAKVKTNFMAAIAAL